MALEIHGGSIQCGYGMLTQATARRNTGIGLISQGRRNETSNVYQCL